MTSETRPEVPAAPRPASSAPTRCCITCGEETEPGWAFCGTCGAPVDALTRRPAAEAASTSVLTTPVPVLAGHENTSSIPAPPPSPVAHEDSLRPLRRGSPSAIAVAVALVLVLAGLAGAVGYRQHQTHNQLLATGAQLASTRHQLAARTAALNETKTRLGATQTSLAGTRTQLSDVQRRLRQARRQLAGLQGSLSSAQNRLDLQAGQIETLKSCLNGVSSALGYVAQNDYPAALAALDAVQVSCQRAQALF